jgi:hypothetical protein
MIGHSAIYAISMDAYSELIAKEAFEWYVEDRCEPESET